MLSHRRGLWKFSLSVSTRVVHKTVLSCCWTGLQFQLLWGVYSSSLDHMSGHCHSRWIWRWGGWVIECPLNGSEVWASSDRENHQDGEAADGASRVVPQWAVPGDHSRIQIAHCIFILHSTGSFTHDTGKNKLHLEYRIKTNWNTLLPWCT